MVTVPSFVAFVDKQVIVGQEARDQAIRNRENTIYHFHKFIGVKYANLRLLSPITLL